MKKILNMLLAIAVVVIYLLAPDSKAFASTVLLYLSFIAFNLNRV